MSTFQVRFRRPEGEEALERSLTGLLTELPNKHCDTLAAAVPGTSEQRLQEFLTTMPWDETDLNRQRVAKLIAEATVGNGVLMFDDTGCAKQGKASVGVARQYSGTLGKVGTCQVAVTCCSSDPHASWPVAVRLSLPQDWTDAPERLRRARVPAEVTFRPGIGRATPTPVAHHPLAARHQGMVAQKICGGACLADHDGRPGPHRLVGGGAGDPWAARGTQVLLE